jgi:hypothetical protein
VEEEEEVVVEDEEEEVVVVVVEEEGARAGMIGQSRRRNEFSKVAQIIVYYFSTIT